VKSLLANIKFPTTVYHPADALDYLPLYHFFRLDPLPYRIVQISILAAFSLRPWHYVEVARSPLRAETHYPFLTVPDTEML